MNPLVAFHLLAISLGLGGTVSLYAASENEERDNLRKVVWVGLLGTVASGPVYGLTDPALLGTPILIKAGLAVALLGVTYWYTQNTADMEPRRRSNVLLAMVVLWLAALLLGVQSAHPV